jgi:CRP-like cAMP-binding protein
MVPYLMRPEDTVIVQGEVSSYFYFITVGECEVKIKDHKSKEKINPKLLERGDYFGECGLLYDCKRSATVTTSNYCTFSKLNKE